MYMKEWLQINCKDLISVSVLYTYIFWSNKNAFHKRGPGWKKVSEDLT